MDAVKKYHIGIGIQDLSTFSPFLRISEKLEPAHGKIRHSDGFADTGFEGLTCGRQLERWIVIPLRSGNNRGWGKGTSRCRVRAFVLITFTAVYHVGYPFMDGCAEQICQDTADDGMNRS
jgi:hypothetical protein